LPKQNTRLTHTGLHNSLITKILRAFIALILMFCIQPKSAHSQGFEYKQKVVAPDRAFADSYGYPNVAANDSLFIVSSMNSDFDSSGINPSSSAGAAYIYQLNQNGSWQFLQKLVSPNRKKDAQFSRDVEITSQYAFISETGYPFDTLDVDSTAYSGLVQIFRIKNFKFFKAHIEVEMRFLGILFLQTTLF
jgi:hypothetical protein